MLVNYFVEFGNKLAPGGGFVIPFLGEARVSYRATDAPEKSGGEPSISWYRWQIAELSHAAELTLVEIRTQLVTTPRCGTGLTFEETNSNAVRSARQPWRRQFPSKRRISDRAPSSPPRNGHRPEVEAKRPK
jgi:hypothetical protein